MIDKIDSSNIQEILAKANGQNARNNNVKASEPLDASLQIDYDALINQAASIQESDQTAFDAAKEMLESGKLLSPENINSAAENIVAFGI